VENFGLFLVFPPDTVKAFLTPTENLPLFSAGKAVMQGLCGTVSRRSIPSSFCSWYRKVICLLSCADSKKKTFCYFRVGRNGFVVGCCWEGGIDSVRGNLLSDSGSSSVVRNDHTSLGIHPDTDTYIDILHINVQILFDILGLAFFNGRDGCFEPRTTIVWGKSNALVPWSRPRDIRCLSVEGIQSLW